MLLPAGMPFWTGLRPGMVGGESRVYVIPGPPSRGRMRGFFDNLTTKILKPISMDTHLVGARSAGQYIKIAKKLKSTD